jgi:hypothetical protein
VKASLASSFKKIYKKFKVQWFLRRSKVKTEGEGLIDGKLGVPGPINGARFDLVNKLLYYMSHFLHYRHKSEVFLAAG